MLNAHYFNALVRMMKSRGYSFITPAEALADRAYLLPDTVTCPRGLSALQRWAVSMGREMRREPAEPEFVTRLYEADVKGHDLGVNILIGLIIFGARLIDPDSLAPHLVSVI
jgi:hypothetical protein